MTSTPKNGVKVRRDGPSARPRLTSEFDAVDAVSLSAVLRSRQDADAARWARLVCSGHTRPIPSISFSGLLADGHYMIISSCKDGKPMLRDWVGDWIGTFIGGHLTRPARGAQS